MITTEALYPKLIRVVRPNHATGAGCRRAALSIGINAIKIGSAIAMFPFLEIFSSRVQYSPVPIFQYSPFPFILRADTYQSHTSEKSLNGTEIEDRERNIRNIARHKTL